MADLDKPRKRRAGREAEPHLAATVKVVLKETNRPIPGATVALYARATMSEADLVGRVQTNAAGIARFLFSAGQLRDRAGEKKVLPLAGSQWQLPGLYSVVADADGLPVVTTRHEAIRDARRAHLQVAVPFGVALRHRLIALKPGRSVTQKRSDWHDTWKALLAKQRPGSKPPVDFCFLRVLLDVMSGLDAPDNRLRKQAAQALNGRASPEQVQELARLGREGVAMVDRLGAASQECTSRLKPEALAELLLRPGGPLENFGQNLLFHVPPPDTGLPAPHEGEAFMVPWVEWFKDCIDHYHRTREHGADWPHDPQALDDMDSYYEDRLQIMAPPSVNQVEAYDPLHQETVRVAEVGAKRLSVVNFDVKEGRRELDLAMHVPLTDSSCLYRHVDSHSPDPGEYQALVIDVQPGQTVIFKGSGFISRQAEIRAQFARWEAASSDADGRLVPRTFGPAPALHGRQLDVFGSLLPHDGFTPQTYQGDWVLLEWPESAPGLYQVTLQFANEQGLANAASQDQETCKLTIDTLREVTTQTLWFAVLPELQPQRVRIRATQLTCVDEKDPEALIINLFDDVNLQASAFLSQYAWSDGEAVASDSAPTSRSADHEFWQDGDSWNVLMNVLPDDGTFRTLGLDEVAYATFLATEVFGDFDRELMKIVIIAIVVIVMLLIVIALTAAIIALVVIPEIALPVEVAVALLGGGGLVALVAGFLFGTFFKEIVAAVTAMLADIDGTDLVAMGTPAICGAELAERLSPLRVHRLFPRPGIDTATVSGSLAVAAEAAFTGGGVEYTYTCTNTEVNSVYRLHVAVEPA